MNAILLLMFAMARYTITVRADCYMFPCRTDYIITLSGAGRFGPAWALRLSPSRYTFTNYLLLVLGSGLAVLAVPRIHPVVRCRLPDKGAN